MTSWKNNNVLGSKKLAEETLNSAEKSTIGNEEALENWTKFVKYGEYNRKLSDLIKEYSTDNITIENLTNEFKDEPINIGVSGRILDATSSEEVESFIKALRKAAEACENFEYNGFKVDWD